MKKTIKALFVLLFVILTVSGTLATAPKPTSVAESKIEEIAKAKAEQLAKTKAEAKEVTKAKAKKHDIDHTKMLTDAGLSGVKVIK